MSGLEGRRVLELGEMVAAPYVAKLLADLGAEVIKIEPPGGERARRRGPFEGAPDPNASGLFLALNTNKRSAVVDVDSLAGRLRLHELVGEADIVIHDFGSGRAAELGLDHRTALAEHPDLVVCAITSFGQTGPLKDHRAEEITRQHGGGWSYQSPGSSKFPEQPPLKVFGHQSDFAAATAAAMVTVAAARRARATGIGEHIDFSIHSYVASMLEAAVIFWTYMGEISDRHGVRLLNPWRIFPCVGGELFLVCVEEDQWERLRKLMGDPEWAHEEIFATMEARNENSDVLEMFIEQWTADQPVEDLWHAGQAERICMAPIFTMGQFESQAHLHARGFFQKVDHPVAGELTHFGAPYRLERNVWSLRTPAPLLGEHTDEGFTPVDRPEKPSPPPGAMPARPLEGIRVADFSWVWAGPFATMHLAHLGAEVIRIESSSRPDLGRRLPIHGPDDDQTLNTSGYANQWAQGKKSIEVDLTSEDGIATAKRLISTCDVVIDNFATGVMDRFGLGYEALKEVRSDLVVATISGYGSIGPLKDYMGYGPTTAPLSGLASLTGYEGQTSSEVGVSMGDPGAGITAAFAICAALFDRDVTGEGQFIDVSLWEATAVCAAEGWMAHSMTGETPKPMGNRDPMMAPHNCYAARGEERWVTIACASDEEFAALAAEIDPALSSDERFATASERKLHEDELDDRIRTWTSQLDRWEITERLQSVGVAAFPSMSPRDIVENEHLRARGFFAELDHPEVGVKTHTGIPWLLSKASNGVLAPAPLLGQHTDEILDNLR